MGSYLLVLVLITPSNTVQSTSPGLMGQEQCQKAGAEYAKKFTTKLSEAMWLCLRVGG